MWLETHIHVSYSCLHRRLFFFPGTFKIVYAVWSRDPYIEVRSSGYGAEPPRQMFKPRTNGGAATGLGGKAVKKPPSGGGGAGGAKLQYPVTSDPPVYFQAKHQLSGGGGGGAAGHANANAVGPPVHHAAVLRCSYSPDGSRLVTASVDKTARVLRLPLSRHGGDGTDLIGHTGAVGAVSWSHDGSLVLTCSPADRSARLWQSGKADPLLTFTHVERNSPGTTKAGAGGGSAAAHLTPFIHEVRAVRFLHLDRFVLLSAGSKLHLYRYWLPDESEKNDIKRLAAEGKYRLAATFASDAQAVNDVAGEVERERGLEGELKRGGQRHTQVYAAYCQLFFSVCVLSACGAAHLI